MRARSPWIDELAADAAADDLDRVAELRRGAGRRRRLGRRMGRDRRRGLPDEAAERGRLGAGAQLVEHGAALPLDVTDESARLFEVVGPPLALARPEVGRERLRVRARPLEPVALGFGLVAGAVELAARRLGRSIARAGPALAGQGARRSRRPGGRRAAARSAARSLADRVVHELVAGAPVSASTSHAATSIDASASANVFTCAKCVVKTTRGRAPSDRSGRRSRAPAPSTDRCRPRVRRAARGRQASPRSRSPRGSSRAR